MRSTIIHFVRCTTKKSFLRRPLNSHLSIHFGLWQLLTGVSFRPIGGIRPSITKLLDVVGLAHPLDVNREPMDCLITITKELRALGAGSLMRVRFKDRIEARRYWSSPTVFNPSLTTTVRSKSTKSFTCWFLPVPLRESRFMPTR